MGAFLTCVAALVAASQATASCRGCRAADGVCFAAIDALRPSYARHAALPVGHRPRQALPSLNLPALSRRTRRTIPSAATVKSADVAVASETDSESSDSTNASNAAQRGDEDYVPVWIPRWVVRLSRPVLVQVVAALGLYFFHMLVLSRSCIAFPVQLIPNKYGLFQSIGLDSCAGLVALAAAYIGRVSMLTNRAAALRGHRDDKALPPVDGNRPNATTAVVTSGEDGQPDPLLPLSPYPWKIPVKSRPKALIVLALLILAYFSSGYGAVVFEWSLYGLSALGVPISIAMHRSLQVLLGHLLWVGTGCLILGIGLRPFFPPRGSWYRLQWRRSWLWWVVGGYYVSSLLFNGADVINQLVLPPSVFQEGGESVVTKMINPENNDILALAVGSIAPCVSAPWWEEVLYRGFTLPALSVFMPPWVALPVSAVLFAVHHMSIQSMIPLATLGLAWGILYMLSNNLLVTVLIHAMWNSRVFLGSFLGL